MIIILPMPINQCLNLTHDGTFEDMDQPEIRDNTLINLIRIKKTDKFPCFRCLDNPEARIMCHECNEKGYINGMHPMVQFV